MPNLETTFVGMRLCSPIVVSSAGITETVERMRRCQQVGAGAVVMKSYFEEVISRRSPTPRFRILHHDLGKEKTFTFMSYEQASEWDIDRYAEEVSRAKAELDIKIIPSLNCITPEGWIESAKKIERAGADAIELNTSCPHGSITFRGQAVEETIFETVRNVREVVSIPIVVKISPMVTSPLAIAKGVEEIGANAVTIFNRMTALEIDVEEQKPVMHGGYAGHGGPWAIQYPLRWISEIRPQIKIDIAGSGGVADWEGVAKYLLVGATVVQTCTAVALNGYAIIREFLDGLAAYMERKGYAGLDEFRGAVNERILGTRDIDRRKRFRAQIRVGLDAPCVHACPAGVPAQAYVSLVAERKFAEALEAIRSKNPFQSICGRVCYHPCESACTRGRLDEPIAIMAIKRFVLEWGRKNAPLSQWEVPKEPPTGKKVAVVGAGPAGLSAAFDLQRLGHTVVVFEAGSQAGGMLRAGIPAYRLPRELIDEEIGAIEKLGVEIRLNQRLGRDFSLADLRRDGYDAMLLSIGSHKSTRLGIPGEETPGVMPGLQFLKRLNAGAPPRVGKRVAVVGGGNTAIDAARSAQRLGAETVYVVYRRTRDEMPASAWEIDAAEAEGVRMLYLVTPVEVLAQNGRVAGLRCVNLFLGEKDASGRRRPIALAETCFTLDVDMVLVAVSQVPAAEDWGSQENLTFTDASLLAVDEHTWETSVEGFFAAGDAVGGGGSVIQAIAEGKAAAVSIHRYLTTGATCEDDASEPHRCVDPYDVLKRLIDTPRAPRVSIGTASPQQRRRQFSEVEKTLTEEEAVAEAKRCLRCGCGVGCGVCHDVCIYFAVEQAGTDFVVDSERCDGCGLCAERCPNSNIEMVPTTNEETGQRKSLE